MRDPAKAKGEILNTILDSSSRQLEESTKSIEEMKSVVRRARAPRERTAVNIILDDQKKVAKALGRLVDDLSEICSRPV